MRRQVGVRAQADAFDLQRSDLSSHPSSGADSEVPEKRRDVRLPNDPLLSIVPVRGDE